MKPLNLFNEAADYIHAGVGFICGVLTPKHPLFALIIFVIFMVYQSEEQEAPARSVRDVVTFLAGYVLSNIYLCFFL